MCSTMSTPSTDICPACLNTRLLLLPRHTDVEEYPCPCCTKWTHGFPGLAMQVNHKRRFLIAPSQPNELAIYIGKPEL